MKIKNSLATDFTQVMLLHKQIFNEDNKSFFESIQTKPYYKTYVSTQNNDVVAYCIISEIAGEAEVINIATKQECRKNGIAANLIKYAIDNTNATVVFLEVSSTNIAAINLYKSVGFNQYGIRKKYYGDTDAILMKLLKN